MPWLLIILLFMPILDIGLAISWLFKSPLAASLYLIMGVVLGVLLIKIGSIGAHVVMRRLQAEGRLGMGWLSGFAAIWAAGALLLFPGYLTDGLAAVFLLGAMFSGKRHQHSQYHQAPPPEDDDETLQAEAVIVDEKIDEKKDGEKRDGN